MTSTRLPALALVAALAPTAAAQERQVQIRSVDFETDVLEVHNFGSTDMDLTGWRFCSHDFDEQRRYTAAGGLNGVTIEAGTSIFVHFNNDAPAGPDNLNRSAVGGNFALPLMPSAYGIQFYRPNPATGTVAFGNASLITDHVQWKIAGTNDGLSETRTAQAVGEGLWTALDDFVLTTLDSLRIDLTDLSGDEPGAPAEYDVTEPAAPCLPDFDPNPPGALDFNDVVAFLQAFAGADPAADIDGNPGLDFNDVVAFLQAFAAGCP